MNSQLRTKIVGAVTQGTVYKGFLTGPPIMNNREHNQIGSFGHSGLVVDSVFVTEVANMELVLVNGNFWIDYRTGEYRVKAGATTTETVGYYAISYPTPESTITPSQVAFALGAMTESETYEGLLPVGPVLNAAHSDIGYFYSSSSKSTSFVQGVVFANEVSSPGKVVEDGDFWINYHTGQYKVQAGASSEDVEGTYYTIVPYQRINSSAGLGAPPSSTSNYRHLVGSTTDDTPVELLTSGGQQIVLSTNTTNFFKGTIQARNINDASESYTEEVRGKIDMGANEAATELISSSGDIVDGSIETVSTTLSADTTNGALKIEFTGIDGKEFVVDAWIELFTTAQPE